MSHNQYNYQPSPAPQAGYQQYDPYSYDQGQYQGWDDGYYDEQQPQQRQHPGGFDQGQMGPRRGYGPPPDQHWQEARHDGRPEQPRGPLRGRPMGPGRGMPPDRQGPPPPMRRHPLSPDSPMNLGQDSPFPTFPSSRGKSRRAQGSMEDAMAIMTINQDEERNMHRSLPGRARGRPGPPPGRGAPGRGRGFGPGGPGVPRQFEGNGRGQSLNPPNPGYGPRSPPANVRGPPPRNYYDESDIHGANPQRSRTLPHRNDGPNGMGHDAQWSGPGRGPGLSVPPRPSTAGAVRTGYGRSNALPGQQYGYAPPLPAQSAQQHDHRYQDGGEDLKSLCDDYYGGDHTPMDAVQRERPKSKESIEMPDFNAIPNAGSRHRRGLSFEGHLSPTSPTSHGVPSLMASPDAHRDAFYKQAAQSRSQPDFHGRQNGAPRVPENTPVPPLPRSGSDPRSTPAQGAYGQRGPPGPGPRLPTNDARYAPSPGQWNHDPRYQRPGQMRDLSDEPQRSDPGPHGFRNGPGMSGTPGPRPGTAGPAPDRMGSNSSRAGGRGGVEKPDALPHHPVPVRAGLLQQEHTPSAARPAPVRQYNSDPSHAGQAPQRRRSAPVTHDELNRLRGVWKANQADNATGLQLVKQLVKASATLADEGGAADAKTRARNRDRFTVEAHKTVKKLVQNGYPDAMFYLADCYGQGLLGLQMDTKEAFTLYQSAAKAGHATSAYRTAVCCEMGHEEGGGTKKDALKAVQWYRRAAALGDAAAMFKMGMILLKGLLGQQRNVGEALNMLKRAAERADADNPHALHELAALHEAQPGNERIVRDEGYALQLYTQAANLGYKLSQFRLGQAYEYGTLGCLIDARTSIMHYTQAAAQEEHQSELALSGWYLTGSQGILDQSDTEAYLWARKAASAEPPLAKALFAMGYFTEVGIGCPHSLEEAKRWYGRAAACKFPKAQERVEELRRGGVKVQKTREGLSRSDRKHNDENCGVM